MPETTLLLRTLHICHGCRGSGHNVSDSIMSDSILNPYELYLSFEHAQTQTRRMSKQPSPRAKRSKSYNHWKSQSGVHSNCGGGMSENAPCPLLHPPQHQHLELQPAAPDHPSSLSFTVSLSLHPLVICLCSECFDPLPFSISTLSLFISLFPFIAMYIDTLDSRR